MQTGILKTKQIYHSIYPHFNEFSCLTLELLVVLHISRKKCHSHSTRCNKVNNYRATNTFNPSDAKRKEIHAHNTLHAYLSMLQQSRSNSSSRQEGNVSGTLRLHRVDILLLLKKHQSGYHDNGSPAVMFIEFFGLGGWFLGFFIWEVWHVDAKWGFDNIYSYRQRETMHACTQCCESECLSYETPIKCVRSSI